MQGQALRGAAPALRSGLSRRAAQKASGSSAKKNEGAKDKDKSRDFPWLSSRASLGASGGVCVMGVRHWIAVLPKFEQYGRSYVQFFIVDVDRLEEWRGINYPEFREALSNANCPPFDPAKDLREEDEDGSLFSAAVYAAYGELRSALARELGIWA